MKLAHPFWRQMSSAEREWLLAFDRWHERGERTPVARAASVEARRIVDAQRWASRNDVTRHMSRVDLALERVDGEAPAAAARQSPVVEQLTRQLKELVPGSGRRKAQLTPQARSIRETLLAIGRDNTWGQP